MLWWISNVCPRGRSRKQQHGRCRPFVLSNGSTNTFYKWMNWDLRGEVTFPRDRLENRSYILISLLLSSWAHSFIYSFNKYLLNIYFVTGILTFRHLAFNANVGLVPQLLQSISVHGQVLRQISFNILDFSICLPCSKNCLKYFTSLKQHWSTSWTLEPNFLVPNLVFDLLRYKQIIIHFFISKMRKTIMVFSSYNIVARIKWVNPYKALKTVSGI